MVMCRQPAIHQARHLGLGDRDLAPPPIAKLDVRDDVIVCHEMLHESVGQAAPGGAPFDGLYTTPKPAPQGAYKEMFMSLSPAQAQVLVL
jgi:hypothetical protein